jgi:hypothetical protein
VEKIVGHWKLTEGACNSIDRLCTTKQWEFMHFEDFLHFSKHSIQINVGEKSMHVRLISWM